MEDLVTSSVLREEVRRLSSQFWRGRRVLVTGHNGFKGAWLVLMLSSLGAKVIGFALPCEDGASGYEALGSADHIALEHIGDVREKGRLEAAFRMSCPEIVIHLAAQAFVGRGHKDPVGTFTTNVGGTVNLLDAVRLWGLDVISVVIVTSDKVYRNDGTGRPFRENDPLGGTDPYSASKAASEFAVSSFSSSFGRAFPATASARAGNVVGGGDFGEDRLIPDLVRAEQAGRPLTVRHPEATRPFQHVLDVLIGYLLLAEDLALKPEQTPRALNFGPAELEMSVSEVLKTIARIRNRPVLWEAANPAAAIFSDAPRLAIDSSLARETLRWAPRLVGDAVFTETLNWYEAWLQGESMHLPSQSAVCRALAV